MSDDAESKTSLKNRSCISISDYLRSKAKSHREFSYYTNLNFGKNDELTTELHGLFFSDGGTWEDEEDKLHIQQLANNKERKAFVRCLNFLKSEDVAMWKMYADVLGIRVKFPKSFFEKLFSGKKHSFIVTLKTTGLYNNKRINVDFSSENIGYKEPNVDFSDVLYINKNDEKGKEGTYYITRSGESIKDCAKEDLKDLQGIFKKNIKFKSETETRLLLYLTSDDIKCLPGLQLSDIKGFLLSSEDFDKDSEKSISISFRPKYLDTATTEICNFFNDNKLKITNDNGSFNKIVSIQNASKYIDLYNTLRKKYNKPKSIHAFHDEIKKIILY